MLTGTDLVRFVKAHPDLTEAELARESGYTRASSNGKEQLLLKSFNKALLAAQGVTFKQRAQRGKTAQFETTVHKNGIVLVGKAYTDQFGLAPGDKLRIVLQDDEIRLVPISE